MRRVSFLLSVLVLSGCHKQAISQGPHFNLDNPPAKRLEAPVAVTIIDARPDWERRAFQGTFSLVPMEDLVPTPKELLQREIERQACDLAEPPSKVRLDLQSFRVVISTEDSFLHHERDYGGPWAPSGLTGGGPEAAAALGVYMAVIGTVMLGIYSYDATTELIRDLRHAHSRPKEMTDDYARGVSCDARTKLVTEWPDGRRTEFQLREVVNHLEQESEYGPGYTRHDAVRDCVRGVCDQLALDWREKLLHPDSEVGKGKHLPVFSAYSGN